MNHKQYSKRGFTIVELLIVIFVIAVVATISMIVYTGIAERAQTAKTTALVESYAKLLRTYRSINGQFPGTSQYAPSGSVCLGVRSDYPAIGAVSEGRCRNFNYPGYTSHASVEDSFNQELLTIATSLPQITKPYATSGGPDQAYFTRGPIYMNPSGHAFIEYEIPGDFKPCPFGRMHDGLTLGEGMTPCSYYLNP